jgi:hypothetical protein
MRHVSDSEFVRGLNGDAHGHKVNAQLVGASLFSHRPDSSDLFELLVLVDLGVSECA